MSLGSFYGYFESKEQLIGTACANALAQQTAFSQTHCPVVRKTITAAPLTATCPWSTIAASLGDAYSPRWVPRSLTKAPVSVA